MKITFWGTRGSLPTSGPDTTRYGGHTSCVEVRGSKDTILILDAGTGIRRLGAAVGSDVSRFDILLSHLHLDHIQGLGFFAPLYQPGNDVHIWGPPTTTLDLRTRLARYLSPPLFPVRIRDFRCRLTLHDVPLHSFTIGEFEVRADPICHPGSTVGYRVNEGSVSLAYLSDHEPALGSREFPDRAEWTSGFDLASAADLLIHDAQYCDGEYPDHIGWGHSSVSQAVAFAALAKVKRLALFHYDPGHNDQTIELSLAAVRRQFANLPFEVLLSAEGLSITL